MQYERHDEPNLPHDHRRACGMALSAGCGGSGGSSPTSPSHRLADHPVDANDGRLLGEVSGIKGAHGTAIAAGSGHGFATSGLDQSVVMFDLQTIATLARIPAAEDADAIVYEAASDRVFTLNGDAHSSTVIDSSGRLITNIPLGGKPEYGAAADGRVYANLTDTSEVVEIDARTATVARRWSTAPCRQLWRSPVGSPCGGTHATARRRRSCGYCRC